MFRMPSAGSSQASPTARRVANRVGACLCFPQFQVGFFYVVMVSLNGLAVALFQRGTTDGYAYSYVQPDPSTFSIWGIIYALLLFLVVNAYRLHMVARTHLCVAFVLNGLWLITNGLAVQENMSYWAAVFVLFGYAFFLWHVYFVMYVDYRESNILDRITLLAPISLNLSWVTLAALLNFSNTAMDDRLDFTKKENRTAIGGPDWAIGVFLLASVIAGYLAVLKSDFVYALGTIWALQGVKRQQTTGSEFPHPISVKVFDAANALTVVLAFAVVIALVRILAPFPYSSNERDSSVVDSSPMTEEEQLGEEVVKELKARFVPLKDSS